MSEYKQNGHVIKSVWFIKGIVWFIKGIVLFIKKIVWFYSGIIWKGIAWFIKSNAHNHEELDKKHLLKGVIYAVLGAVCQGIGLVFAKKGLVLLQKKCLN
jgi:hypothetical protein